MESVVEKFLRYVKIDTRSDREADTSPSTAGQWVLARLLADELRGMGLGDVNVSDHAVVTAVLPANRVPASPVIGFIAHMDTSGEVSGKDVCPMIHDKYDGGDIVLNSEKNIVLSPCDFPELRHYVGETLITTDGNTLLGADDKAGVAEIMTAVEYLVEHPQIPHGEVRIAFTPDEEIGRGVDHFDVEQFGANFAYTLDGGSIGELEYENFNAAEATITFHGRSVHPGSAKGKMVNALHIAMEFNAMLPAAERPEHTEHYEGFFHLTTLTGDVEQASCRIIVRDHDYQRYKQRIALLQGAAAFLNQRYGANLVDLEIKEQYLNMREKILPVMHIVETACKAMEMVGVKPVVMPVRGGTDGARLSYMGLPTPNLFTGGHNYHSRYEFIPVLSMQKAVEVVLKIIELYCGWQPSA
ncbi:MAG: peptidase T [Anaerolineae bacterium]|nr:peptidase T [Anaerolineae bacterium]